MNFGGVIRLAALLCCLPLAAWALRGDDTSVIYPLPLAETQEVVDQWMERNGFQVYQYRSPKGSNLELTAEKHGAAFVLLLRTQSPLATQVRFQLKSGNAEVFIRALRAHLDGYLHLPNAASHNTAAPIPAVVRSLQNAVVCIYAERAGREFQISGFVLDPQGLIICTAHDLKSKQQVSVVNHDAREFKGQVVRIDSQRDLALVSVPAPFDIGVSLQEGRYLLRNGESLFAVTCPGSAISGIKTGFLDGPPRRVQGLPLWQVQMHIDRGSSGSPVFDSQGRLAAIVKGRFRGTDSVGFLIPFETLLHFLEKY